MSLKRIPSKYLNTTIDIYRDETTTNDVGDLDVVQATVYGSVASQIQPAKESVEYNIQGIVHLQTHVGYLNRYDGVTPRNIRGGDTVLDRETLYKYLVLGVKNEETMRLSINNTGHIELILEHLADQDGEFVTLATSATAKASIT